MNQNDTTVDEYTDSDELLEELIEQVQTTGKRVSSGAWLVKPHPFDSNEIVVYRLDRTVKKDQE